MIILAIETSCDETAISIIRTKKNELEILSDAVSSQVSLHAPWGGVVPSLAAREHLKNLPLLLAKTLQESQMKSLDEIDLIAVTQGPGLIPALLIGTSFAKTLSYKHHKPLLGIHHIEGHIYANFLGKNSGKIKFPLLCLVVSGGHTQLVFMKNHLQYEIIGQTLDDAAGEAFDKVARILGLGYPGGPIIAQEAASHNAKNKTYPIQLPRPMIHSQNFNFSFSGLKTAVLYETKKNPALLKDKNYVAAVAQEFQQATIDVLTHKTMKAAEKYNPKTIMLAGGVSANQELRKQLENRIKQDFPKISYCVPDFQYSIDNATMIAAAALFRYQKMSAPQRKKLFDNWKNLEADANLKLK